MKNNQIVIGTSLAPFDFEKQIKAVKSWIENGFYVISCNTQEEIIALENAFESVPIEFVEVKKNAEKICGKKLPYIQEILDIVSSKSERVCGFINSDIILSDISDDMYKFILHESVNSVVFVRRYEIDQYSDIQELNWELNFDGIDLFFMDKFLVPGFYDDDFYVQSGWNPCFLIKCEILGIKIKELVNPVAFHLRHLIKWNFRETNILVMRFMKKYFDLDENAYGSASGLYYRILCEKCKQICFYAGKKYRCLFVLNKNEREMTKSIQGQHYKDIVISNSDKKKENFDIVIYINGTLILSEIYCKVIFYIMEQYSVGQIYMGRFFASESNGKKYFNQLSRNIKLVKKINEDTLALTHIVKREGGKKKRTLYLPISYEVISSNDVEVIDMASIKKKAYIMPAGVRGGEWFDVNKDRLALNIKGYIDNDKNKVGKKINGKPIYSIDVLEKDKDYDFVIIASKRYSFEIEEQLLKSINKENILNASYILFVNTDSTISYFSLDKYKKNRRSIC